MAHNTRLNVLPQRNGPQASRPFLGGVLPSAAQGVLEPARSLYLHIPFCSHKCHYCDFYSVVDTQDRQEAFTDRLILELQALGPYSGGLPLKSIFIGGGTPSLLAVPLWERLLASLRGSFDLSSMGQGGTGEFTVECNPESASEELMATLRGGRVTRVSMGAQSFDPRHLKTLERWHAPENVARAIARARSAGIERQSIDLIFGVPGQSIDQWQADIREGLSLGTEHISCYSLTYEPATAMTARLHRGEFVPMDEESEVGMHRIAWEEIRSSGLERYEVSNFARPGAECRHNLAYWRQESWLAAGPSASGHLRTADGSAGFRWKNAPRLDDYLSIQDGSRTSVLAEFELPDPARAVRELIMTSLRIAEGIDPRLLLERAERVIAGSSARLAAAAIEMRRRGLLTEDESRWVLSDEGILFADGLAVEFFEALEG